MVDVLHTSVEYACSLWGIDQAVYVELEHLSALGSALGVSRGLPDTQSLGLLAASRGGSGGGRGPTFCSCLVLALPPGRYEGASYDALLACLSCNYSGWLHDSSAMLAGISFVGKKEVLTSCSGGPR